jgi:hypothetical protein
MHIAHTLLIQQEGQEDYVVTEISKELVEEVGELCEEVLGNGKAQVNRSRSTGYSMNFGSVRIQSHCSITLSCNQDVATIAQAAEVISHIVDKVVFEDDAQVMQDYLEHHRRLAVE